MGFSSTLRITGPSNGRVKEPVGIAGFGSSESLVTSFEGSGYLGQEDLEFNYTDTPGWLTRAFCAGFKSGAPGP